MVFQLGIDHQKARLESLLELEVRVGPLARIFVLFTVQFFDVDWQRDLHEIANLAAELPMAVANTEDMQRWVPTDIRRQDVLVLVDLIWVVRVVAHPRGEGELSDAVFALLVYRLLLGLVLAWVLKHRRVSA